jgi:hypothetical protein
MVYIATFSCYEETDNGMSWETKTTDIFYSLEKLNDALLREATSGYRKDMCEIEIFERIQCLETNELPGYQEKIEEIAEKKRNQEARAFAAIIESRRKLYESLKKEFEN